MAAPAAIPRLRHRSPASARFLLSSGHADRSCPAGGAATRWKRRYGQAIWEPWSFSVFLLAADCASPENGSTPSASSPLRQVDMVAGQHRFAALVEHAHLFGDAAVIGPFGI